MKGSHGQNTPDPRLGRRIVLGSLIAAAYAVYLTIWLLIWLRDSGLHANPEFLVLAFTTSIVMCVVLVDAALFIQWAVSRMTRTALDQASQLSAHFRRWIWWFVVIAFVSYPPWILLHSTSFAIVHVPVAALGPIVVGVLAFWRQRDWRFLALALLYPFIVLLFIYVMTGPP